MPSLRWLVAGEGARFQCRVPHTGLARPPLTPQVAPTTQPRSLALGCRILRQHRLPAALLLQVSPQLQWGRSCRCCDSPGCVYTLQSAAQLGAVKLAAELQASRKSAQHAHLLFGHAQAAQLVRALQQRVTSLRLAPPS